MSSATLRNLRELQRMTDSRASTRQRTPVTLTAVNRSGRNASMERTFTPDQAVNDSTWLSHDMVLSAIREADADALARYALEADAQDATLLARDCRTVASGGSLTSERAFDAAVRANPAAVGEYLGRVALKARELTVNDPRVDAIDAAFGLVNPPLEVDARNAPTQRERNVVTILIGARS